jgi:hypothetical protein
MENLAAKVNPKTLPLDSIVGDPALVETFDREASVEVLARLLRVAGPVFLRFVAHVLQECQARDSKRSADRLLGTKEICERIGCSMSTLMVGWKAGRYPFMLKDGGRLLGSEDGLERWIKTRIKRQSLR